MTEDTTDLSRGLGRRDFLRLALLGTLALGAQAITGCTPQSWAKNAAIRRIALLHLAPRAGDVDGNRKMIEAATLRAAAMGADWVITPELCVSGYEFVDSIGTDWIEPQPDAWLKHYSQMTARLGLAAFIGTPDRDPLTDKLYNAALAFDRDGSLVGRHRKVDVVPVHDEQWSSPGESIAPLMVDGVNIGILICADSYTPDVAMRHKELGAQFLVSPVAWMPGECGPEGVWEQRTLDTGLPLVVCNRTGQEPSADFRESDSVAVQDGKRQAVFRSPLAAVVALDWQRQTLRLASAERHISYLSLP